MSQWSFALLMVVSAFFVIFVGPTLGARAGTPEQLTAFRASNPIEANFGLSLLAILWIPIAFIPALLASMFNPPTPGIAEALLDFFYFVQVAVFVVVVYPETVKTAFYHFVAMTSEGRHMSADDTRKLAEHEKKERAVEGQLVRVEDNLRNLVPQVPGMPPVPAGDYNYPGYWDSLESRVQNYFDAKRIGSQNEKLAAIKANLELRLQLQSQLDDLQRAPEILRLRRMTHSVEESETMHRLEKSQFEREKTARERERFHNPPPPPAPKQHDPVADMLVAMTAQIESGDALDKWYEGMKATYANRPNTLALGYAKLLKGLVYERPGSSEPIVAPAKKKR